MPVITVPSGIRLVERSRWRLRTATPTSGPGLDSRQQWIHRENRVWTNTLGVLDAWGRDSRGAYMAFLDMLKGPAYTFTVPVGDFYTPGAGFFHTEGGEFHVETDEFHTSDGTNPTLTVAAPAAATILNLSEAGSRLQPGSFLSRNDFLYRVATSDGEGVVTINPPLREAIAEDAEIEIIAPKIRVRLDSDDAANAAHDFAVWGGSYTLSVIEAFDR